MQIKKALRKRTFINEQGVKVVIAELTPEFYSIVIGFNNSLFINEDVKGHLTAKVFAKVDQSVIKISDRINFGNLTTLGLIGSSGVLKLPGEFLTYEVITDFIVEFITDYKPFKTSTTFVEIK